jgi:hypothetical protein
MCLRAAVTAVRRIDESNRVETMESGSWRRQGGRNIACYACSMNAPLHLVAYRNPRPRLLFAGVPNDLTSLIRAALRAT